MWRTMGVAALVATSGCLRVHHVQVGEIDATGPAARPFVLEVTTAGVDVGAVAGVAGVPVVSDIVTLFSQGPRTGIPTYVPGFVGDLQERLAEKCPTGRVTGLQVRRSSLVVPFAGEERVRIQGWCVGEEGW